MTDEPVDFRSDNCGRAAPELIDALVAANPGLRGHPALPRTLAALFDMTDDAGFDRLEDWRYPEPEEPHPVGGHAQTRKIRNAQAEAGATPIWALAHGYGPVADFARRFRLAHEAALGNSWVNRYGYLADAKLDAIGAVIRDYKDANQGAQT